MILICFGTRPEWLKIKPLLATIKCKTLFTGQHLDLVDNLNFDYKIHQKEELNRLDSIIINCLKRFPNDPEITSVLVQGDTASAFACALAAYNRGLKVIHLEAGLRSYDLNNPYPEEAYRQMISRISDVNLCPTNLSKENLINEKINSHIYVVGNTILDNLVELKQECSYTNEILVTLHRRENHAQASEWFKEINKLAKLNPHLTFTLPLHPNPNIQRFKGLLSYVNVIDPLPHEDLIRLLAKCKFVITDSGGLQEEGAFLNKKIIVCRETTERPEAIETGHLFLCGSPKQLSSCFDKIDSDYYINSQCPYGDGHSSKKIKQVLQQLNIIV